MPTPIDALLAAQVDGAPLPDELVVELVYMILSGGVDTSTALIAHIARYLSSHPDVADELRGDASLIPKAVDEMLRYFSPGTGVARTVTHDTGYPMRWYGPYIALAYDWLHDAPGVDASLLAHTVPRD